MTRLTPVFLAFALAFGLTGGAKAGPVDTFDVDILTASRYGIDKVDNWRPCHGRASRGAHVACDYLAEHPASGRF